MTYPKLRQLIIAVQLDPMLALELRGLGDRWRLAEQFRLSHEEKLMLLAAEGTTPREVARSLVEVLAVFLF